MTYYSDDFEVDGVLEALEVGLELAECEFEQITSLNDTKERAAATEWVASVVDAALKLRAPQRPGDIRAAYWVALGGEPPSRKEHDELMRDLAAELEASSGNPALIDLVRTHEYRDRKEEPEHVLMEGLRYKIAELHLGSLPRHVERLRQIYHLSLDVPLPERIDKYLARVARLYVYELDAEVVVFSRSVLEMALNDAIPDSLVRDKMAIPPKQKTVSLIEVIECARRLNVLDHSGKDCADVIRVRGNAALHSGPESLAAVGGPYNIIVRLTTCLTQISRYMDRAEPANQWV